MQCKLNQVVLDQAALNQVVLISGMNLSPTNKNLFTTSFIFTLKTKHLTMEFDLTVF